MKRRLYDRRGRVVSTKQSEAFHEAGHAVAARALRITVFSATIVDPGDAGGGAVVTDHPRWVYSYLIGRLKPRVQHDERRRATVEKYIVQSLAGRVAERMLLRGGHPPKNWRGNDDAVHAHILARLLGVPRGKTIRTFVEGFAPRTRELLEREWPAVEALAHELAGRYARAFIDGDDVDRILARARVTRRRAAAGRAPSSRAS